MGSDSCTTGEGISDGGDDSVLDVLHSISPENLSLCLPLAANAKPLRLHLWHCLVGNSPQFDCVFCCRSCKYLLLLFKLGYIPLFRHN